MRGDSPPEQHSRYYSCKEFIAVKVFLQQCETGFFLTGNDLWTDNETKARDFVRSRDAIRWAVHARMRGVQVVLRFYGSRQPDLILPLKDPRKLGKGK